MNTLTNYYKYTKKTHTITEYFKPIEKIKKTKITDYFYPTAPAVDNWLENLLKDREDYDIDRCSKCDRRDNSCYCN